MTRPIVGYLAEFTPVPRPEDVVRDDPSPADDPAAESASVVSQMAEARQQGFDEGRELAQADGYERCRVLTASHATALAAARADWASAEGSAWAEQLRAGLAALELSLGDHLAAVVTPFIEPASRTRTVAELRQALAELLAGGHGPHVAVRGPADVIEALRTAWGDQPGVTFAAAESREVLVEAGDTTIRSQMQAWSDRFQRAFQAPA